MLPAPLAMRIFGAAPLACSSSIPCRSPRQLCKAAHHRGSLASSPANDRSSSFLCAFPIPRQFRIGVSASNFSKSSGKDPTQQHSRIGVSFLEFSRGIFEERRRSLFCFRALSPVVSVIGGSVFERGCCCRVGSADVCRSAGRDLSCLLHCADQRRYAAGVRSHHLAAGGERMKLPGGGTGLSEPSSHTSTSKRAAAFSEDAQSSLGGAPLADLEKEKFKEVSIKQTEKLLTLPTILTLARIAAVPAILAVFYSKESWATNAGAAIFVLAAITDWLDGYLARKMGSSSAFGAFLDPVADKLMVAAVLVLLCTKPPPIADLAAIPWLLPIPTIAIIGREITMSAVREWAAAQGGDLHKAVAVSSLGKIKTASQMVAITLLLASGEGGLDSKFAGVLGVSLLYVAAILALWSLAMYMKGIWGSMLK